MNWQQFKTILWLRRRLTRNQWSRSGFIGPFFAVIVSVLAFIGGTLAFAAGLLGGWLGLGQVSPLTLSLVWLALTGGFLFFWTVGLLSELQRSESIDLQRLMHLPVLLGQVFVINYAASHFVPSIVLAVPAMIGLATGLVISRGTSMLLLVPLSLAMVFMITAWTYCLRGWLATLMSNPRKRRAIIMGITFAFVLLGQLPNLVNAFSRHESRNSGRHSSRGQNPGSMSMLKNLDAAQKFIPPLWLPVGARALADHHAWPAVAGVFGCLAIGTLGLRRAYRDTIRFYHGDAKAKLSAHVEPVQSPSMPAAVARGRRLVERRIPGLPDPASAVAAATLQSMLRAPEVKMAWAMSFIIAFIFGGSMFLRNPGGLSEAAKPFAATGAVVFSVFMMIQFLGNQFGYDRDGFRTLVLAPVDRRHILLGKNFATLPVAVLAASLMLGIAAIGLQLPAGAVFASVLQLVALLTITGIAGNLLSILVPYRIQAGSMKPTKMPAQGKLMLMAFHLLTPVFFVPVFVPPLCGYIWHKLGMSPLVPVNVVMSFTIACVAIGVYLLVLPPMARLLQRREQLILKTVTSEIE